MKQYSRTGNLRFSGIPETGKGEDTTAKVVEIINRACKSRARKRIQSSSGCDGITLKQLKYLRYVLIKPLTLLINQILNTGIYLQIR